MGQQTQKLASTIKSNKDNTEALGEDSFPDDQDANLLLNPLDSAQVTITVVGTRLNYDPTSFILDHPVYGDLDSSTLNLDGGYLVNETGAEFPLNFGNNGGLGFAFNEDSVSGSSVLFTYTA